MSFILLEETVMSKDFFDTQFYSFLLVYFAAEGEGMASHYIL